jgi:hypothetical protein
MKTTLSLDTAAVSSLGMLLIRVGLLALLGFGAARFGLGMGAADQFGKTSTPTHSSAGKG